MRDCPHPCVILSLVALLAACATGSSTTDSAAELVSPAEFERLFAQVGMPQSMHDCVFLGVRGGHAYLERRSMASSSQRWTRRRVGVALGDLDAAFRQRLVAADAALRDGR